jgi:cold shock CspA family protein
VNLYLVIRDAFAALKRQLEEYTRKQKGRIKKHPSHYGTIARLFDDYGFIESPDGNEYYFHAVNLANTTFGELSIGLMVCFTEVAGGDSLQANHITSLHAKEMVHAKAA